MSAFFRVFLYSAALLGIASSAYGSATNTYIAQNAAGAANGQDCANARASGFFNTAGNWGSGSTQIGPGTTVHLCGTITGSVGAQLLAFQASGSPGNPITLLFENGAVAEAPYFASSTGGAGCGGGICGANQSYVTIDGGANGIIRNTANATGSAHNTLMVDIHNCNQCTVQNLAITNVYRRTSSTDTAMDETQMKCIEFSGSNLLIKNNTINSAGWCLFDAYKNGDTNIDISYNTLTNFAHGIMFATSGAYAATNIQIHDNNFAGPGTMWDGPGCPFHQDGIHIFGTTGSSIDNFYFYNNYFHGDWGSCPTGWVFVEASGAGTPANMRNSYWWNNVGVVDPNSPIVNTNGWFNISSGISGSQKVFNNTIVGPKATDNTACFSLGWLSSLTFENNLVTNCGDPIFLQNTTVATVDYNYYGTSCQNGNNCFVWNGSFTGSFSAWKSACGCDSHAIQNNSTLFNADGSPQTNSPAIGGALNLASIVMGVSALNLNTDTSRGNTRTPVTRPLVGAWAMGAYSSGGSTAPPPLSPPSVLSLIVN